MGDFYMVSAMLTFYNYSKTTLLTDIINEYDILSLLLSNNSIDWINAFNKSDNITASYNEITIQLLIERKNQHSNNRSEINDYRLIYSGYKLKSYLEQEIKAKQNQSIHKCSIITH
jgi:hypothetical protein